MIPLLACLIWLLTIALELFGIEFESRWETNFPKVAFLESLRSKFLQTAIGVSADSRALVLGLTIGERDLLSEELALEMKQLSLTHLVAVSGANLAIVAGAIYLLAAKLALPRDLRFSTAAISITAYVLLVGPEPSVLRAFAMTLAVLFSLWLGRGTSPVVALAWAVLVILVSDPAMGTNFGFALSAFATLGLLLVAQPLFHKFELIVPKWLALGFATAISAQLYTLPIVLMLDPSIPAYAVIANLLVEPMVAPVTILGIISVSLLPIGSGISGLISLFASLGTYWIELVAEIISRWPMVRLHWLPGWIGIAVAIVLAIFISLWLHQIRARQSLLIGILVFVFSISWVSADVLRFSSWPGRNWDLVMCDVGQGDSFVIRSDGQVALVDVGREDSKVDFCLTQLGINHIDLLVISHFDLDHAGGINGALKNRTIGRALVSGFQDDRPVVETVRNSLASKGALPELAHKELSGNLGSGIWKVLSPSVNAAEASDSNDASIVMRFDFEQYSFLTLGDLGEQGQERLLRKSMADLNDLSQRRLVLKVAHHGSADQSQKLTRMLRSDLALISVGKNNDYGHPTSRTLDLLATSGVSLVRSDLSGSVGVQVSAGNFDLFAAGKLAQ